MTIAQMEIFLEASRRRELGIRARLIHDVRVAFGAESKACLKFIKSLEDLSGGR